MACIWRILKRGWSEYIGDSALHIMSDIPRMGLRRSRSSPLSSLPIPQYVARFECRISCLSRSQPDVFISSPGLFVGEILSQAAARESPGEREAARDKILNLASSAAAKRPHVCTHLITICLTWKATARIGWAGGLQPRSTARVCHSPCSRRSPLEAATLLLLYIQLIHPKESAARQTR